MTYEQMVEELSKYLGDDLTDLKIKLYAKLVKDSIQETWE